MQFTMSKDNELGCSVRQSRSLPMRNDGRVSPNTAEIKRLRKLSCYSQEFVAGMTGISIKTIRNLESKNNRRCKLVTLKSLAIFFDVDIWTLINHEGALHIPEAYVIKAYLRRPLEIGQDTRESGMIRHKEHYS
jgi:transcriptional regulator with XRE-family HTH domain